MFSNKGYSLRLLSFALAALLALVPVPAHSGAAPAEAYPGLSPDAFMKSWLVLRSIPIPRDGEKPPTEEAQRAAFARDWLESVGGEVGVGPAASKQVTIATKSFEWRAVESKGDIVDLKADSEPGEFAVAYAWAEIDMREPTKGLLGIGSDDAVKVWLNGKLIHERWIGRPAKADDDIVRVSFVGGKNRLLIKVLNMISDWGFCCRLMGPDTQAGKFINAIWTSGDVEALQGLIDAGLDVNSHSKEGLTPWLAARLRGQPDLADFLARKGAETNVAMPPLEKMADSLFRLNIKPGGPGAAVLLARDGKVLFEKGYGMADIEHHLPITVETKFRIGSITKQFTAAAILKLQEQGKLSAEDKLSKYYPEFPRGGEVTLRHLLTHTSGIHSYTDKPGFMDKVTSPITADALVKSFENDPFEFSPGAQWKYCNSGYFLLGCIVEKVAGETYEEFLRHTLFEPLGMTNTGVHHANVPLPHEALGYDGGPKRAVNWDMTWAGGAGALYSTVEDLFRWNEALFNGRVLNEASLEAAFQPVKTKADKEPASDTGYGFGWAINKFRGAREIGHGGGLNGFTSSLLRLPDKHFTVVVLANGAPNAQPQALAEQTTEIYLGTELEPRPRPVKVSPAALELVAGRYDYGMAVLTVEREGEHLFAQLGTQPRFEIFPKSETEFFWRVTDAQVNFVKGPDGKIVEAVHHQGGGTIHAPRLEPLRIAQVDPAAYNALVGTYKVTESDVLATVTREGDRLFGMAPGQSKIELLPKSATEFGFREINAQVIFLKDTNGVVTRAKLIEAGKTTDATKVK